MLHLITHNQTHTHTLGRTPLDEGWARGRGRNLHNTQQTHETNIHAPAGFEPPIPTSERAQIYALGRKATGIDSKASTATVSKDKWMIRQQ
jgi:hypothetical protein